MSSLRRWLREPLEDYLVALEHIRPSGVTGLLVAAIAMVATWFVYVPIHELLHAWGCLATGGTVSRLDIAPEYGGALLAQFFPYVRSGSEYAGQLSGFDTKGSDFVYLATVLAPYLLTVFIGVPLLKYVGREGTSRIKPLLLGIAVVLAYSPIISLIGDYYEAGSIVVSRIAHAIDASIPIPRWRSDDVPKLIGSLNASGATMIDWIGVALSFVAGLVLALATWRAGALVNHLFAGTRQSRHKD